MAFLGLGDYLCEACKHFDTDGNDGNHPNCAKQGGEWSDNPQRAIPLGEECPYGYEFGVPFGYPVSMERNERRAKEVRAMMELGPEKDSEECGAKGGGEMSEIKLTKRFPESRPEDITEAYMRGYEAGRRSWRNVRETCEDVSENPLRFECSACGGVSLDIVARYCPCCGAEVKR